MEMIAKQQAGCISWKRSCIMVIIWFGNENMLFLHLPIWAEGRNGYDEDCVLQYETL